MGKISINALSAYDTVLKVSLLFVGRKAMYIYIMGYFKKLIRPYLIWSVVLIVIPLLMIFLYAFTQSGNSLLNIQFTLDNFIKFADEVYVEVFVESFKLGLLTVIICFFLGYTLAYIISRFSEKLQSFLILLVTIPMWINMIIRIYAWKSILEPLGLMYTDFAVMVGQICEFLPFMVIPIHTSLSKMDKSLIEASYDLGATHFQTFVRVIFKLSIPGVINGIIMVFLLSVSTFMIPQILGGGQYILIGNLIEKQFIEGGDWNFGSAVSLVLAVIILLLIRWMKKVDKE